MLGKNLKGAKIKDSLGNTHKNPHVFLSKIQRHYFSNGETIIEALISGDLDVGCMGLSPALVAMDKGADFKIAFGISVSQAEVIAIDKNINSLNDIKALKYLDYDNMLFIMNIYDLDTLSNYARKWIFKKFKGNRRAFLGLLFKAGFNHTFYH